MQGRHLAAVAACALAGAIAVPGVAQAQNYRYIVQLDRADGAAPARAAEIEQRLAPLGGDVVAAYQRAINGVVITLPVKLPGKVRLPGQISIEPEQRMTISATQAAPPWGLDRIDQAALPLSSSYSYTSAGAGVDAYVIDTGIRTTHTEFEGRAVIGKDATGGNGQDCNGHGTHVAGTIGGKTYGVAKATRLIAVRVLGCDGSGTNTNVIAGIDWAIANHQAGQPAVANMSLGGGASSAVDTAVNNLVNDGVSVSVAAGNSSTTACTSSPARVANAITVAASDQNDKFASFSNTGSCVDVIAPGVGVLSSVSTSDTATATYNGTSMATPHAAGVAARLLSASPTRTPAQIQQAIVDGSVKGKVTSIRKYCTYVFFGCTTTQNRLLNVSATS